MNIAPLSSLSLPGSAAVRPARRQAPSAEPVDRAEVRGSQARGASFEVVRRLPSAKWAWTEQLRDPDPHFVQRNFHPRQVQRHPEVVEAFGTATPHSGDLLLHYAGDPPAGAPRRETPVILVHGASKAGNFWWDPKEDGSEHGLPQYLRDQGYQVYFVSFAHNQDDNFLWAEQVANAVERVRQLTGAEKVDLVGHSKGGVPTRMYASGVREPWMTPFRGDVRRLVLVGAPNGGIDYSFRHPVANYGLYGDSDNPRLNAPISWERMIAHGRWVDTADVGFGSQGPDYWPGQRQMLARQDHPLSNVEPDWYTTYHGGRGFVSRSAGIDHYVEQGGRLVERLAAHPVDRSVEVAVLAGNKPDVPGILNEYTGPSDGLVFVDSALAMPESTRVVAQQVLPLHHKAITSEPEAHRWVADVLAAENPAELTPAERRKIVAEGLRDGRRWMKEVHPERGPAERLHALQREGIAALPPEVTGTLLAQEGILAAGPGVAEL